MTEALSVAWVGSDPWVGADLWTATHGEVGVAYQSTPEDVAAALDNAFFESVNIREATERVHVSDAVDAVKTSPIAYLSFGQIRTRELIIGRIHTRSLEAGPIIG